jgi:hypothetical protein
MTVCFCNDKFGMRKYVGGSYRGLFYCINNVAWSTTSEADSCSFVQETSRLL